MIPSASATTCEVAAVPRNWQPPPGTGAGPAAQLGGLGQGELAVGIAGADRLDLAGVFAVARGQGDTAGDQNAGQVLRAGQGHHHGGQPLVAGGDPEDSLAARQRPNQAPENDGRVIAIRQAVHHPGGPLGTAVAGVGNHAGKRDDVEPPQLLGGFFDQEADLPVAGVIAQSDRLAIGPAQAPLSAQNQVWVARDLGCGPAHARVLGQAEEIAGGPVSEHLVGQRK